MITRRALLAGVSALAIVASARAHDPVLSGGWGDRLNSGAEPSMVMDFAKTKALQMERGGSAVTLTRADASTCATYFDSAGALQTAAANVPRFDHNPATGESLGLLIEGARTNVCLQSNGFDTTWTNTLSVDASAQGTSPDGTNNAWKITDNSGGGTGQVYVSQDITLTNAAYTFSVFAKADQLSFLSLTTAEFTNTGSSWFDLANGVVGTLGHTSSGIQAVGNGWYRCWITWTPGADVAGNVRIRVAESDNAGTMDLDGTSSILIYGAQVELGTFPSAYIPTTTSSTARAADVCTVTGLDTAGWFNLTASTALVEFYLPTSSSGNEADSPYIFSIDDGTDTGRASTFCRSLGTAVRNFLKTPTQTRNTNSGTYPIAYGVVHKNVIAWDQTVPGSTDGVAGTIDGEAPATAQAPNPALTGVTTMRLGMRFDNVSHMFGHISRIAYWPQRLPDDALVRMTA